MGWIPDWSNIPPPPPKRKVPRGFTTSTTTADYTRFAEEYKHRMCDYLNVDDYEVVHNHTVKRKSLVQEQWEERGWGSHGYPMSLHEEIARQRRDVYPIVKWRIAHRWFEAMIDLKYITNSPYGFNYVNGQRANADIDHKAMENQVAKLIEDSRVEMRKDGLKEGIIYII
jgi:hypothetical protein